MKAFVCHNEHEDHAIIYAETRNKAKWQFIEQHNDGDMGGVSVTRAKRLDEYGSSSDIPFRELVWMGGWGECHNCGMRIDEDGMLDEGMDPADIQGFYNRAIYCSTECSVESKAMKEEEERMEARIVERMMWKLEDRFGKDNVEFLSVHTYLKAAAGFVVHASIEVRVDGYALRYGGNAPDETSITFQEWLNLKTYPLYIARGDMPHFEEKYGL